MTAFISLSCSARRNSIYVVANLGEVVHCSHDDDDDDDDPVVCPQDGAFQYNTNVVFDRNGRLIARYLNINE